MMSRATISERYGSHIGRVFGHLTLIGISDQRGDGGRLRGQFKCECGGDAIYPLSRMLDDNYRTHCGCRTDHGAHRKHGMRSSPEYSSWGAMKARCLDPNNKDYPRWGGKGITIFARWIDSFDEFYAHVGPRPQGTTLDRIDGRLGYEPGNVRWATHKEQQRNRSSSYRWHIKGILFESHRDAAEHYGVSGHTIWRWVNGQFDRRRNCHTEPREDCYVISRY